MGLQRVRHDRATELNPLLSLFISLINYPRFGQWELFPLESCPFDIFSSFFEDFLTFGHNDIFQAHLIYFLPRPWDPPFLYGALVPFRR